MEFKKYKHKDKLDFYKRYAYFITEIELGQCEFEIYNWLENETECVCQNQIQGNKTIEELNQWNQSEKIYEEPNPWILRSLTPERICEFNEILSKHSDKIQERLYEEREKKKHKRIK